jgi:hypothetical protein
VTDIPWDPTQHFFCSFPQEGISTVAWVRKELWNQSETKEICSEGKLGFKQKKKKKKRKLRNYLVPQSLGETTGSYYNNSGFQIYFDDSKHLCVRFELSALALTYFHIPPS